MLILAAIALSSPSLLAFAEASWRRYPEMRIEDAYKWLYHASLGGEHALSDDSGPRQWMDMEWPTLGRPLKGEPTVVPLDPDRRIIRVNLRPYRAAGGDREMLLAVFVSSAMRFKGDKRNFLAQWRALDKRLQQGPIAKITHQGWRRLDSEMRAENYPAIHHSKEYTKAYKPAYRLVLRELWP